MIGEFKEEFGQAAPAKAPAQHNDDPVAGLEKRIAGVERAIGITVNLLRQVIRRDEPQPELKKKTR